MQLAEKSFPGPVVSQVRDLSWTSGALWSVSVIAVIMGIVQWLLLDVREVFLLP